jgi:serine/threonine-protein kinase
MAAGGGDVAPVARGTVIGRYTVLTLVGRGGMGQVYSAYDPELDRRIALKLLNAQAGADDARAGSRLVREAKAIARVHHPNVVIVHDTGSFGSRVFIAMEFVDGQTLAAWLDAAPRTQAQILEVFAAAGRGLEAAHAAGLVHRDFKPQNVMVGADGDVRVMDFGLARALGGAAEHPEAPAATLAGATDPSLTATGELVGTPLYMAPEQFAGKPTDARTDQFSFCVALYQALYGAHPFGGAQLGELMEAVGEGRIQPPPAKNTVAPWRRKILLRGLATRPEDRFSSMAELLAALGRDPAVRRRRWLGASGAALLVAGVAGVSSHYLTNAPRPTCDGGAHRIAAVWGPAQRDAVDRAFRAIGNERAAQALASTTSLLDKYVGRWTAMHREACEANVRNEQSAQVLDLRMACLDERLATVRALAATLATADGSLADNAVAAVATLPSLDRCSDVPALRAVVKPPEDPATRRKVAEAREQLATVGALTAAGRCDQATRLGRPLLATARQIGYLPLQAEALLAFGQMQDTCLDTKEAIADLEDAVVAAESSHYDEIAIDAAALLACTYSERRHDVVAARRWHRLAGAMLARYPGHPRLEARLSQCGSVLSLAEGRLEEALQETRRALAAFERLEGPSSLLVSTSVNNVALLLHELGRDEEAEGQIRRALELIRGTYGDNVGQFALSSVNQCEILTALGKFEAAHHAIERALAIWRGQNAGSFLIGYALLDQGRLALAEGRPKTAIVSLKESLTLLGDQNPRYAAEAQFALARALVAASPAERGHALGLARKAREALRGDASVARLANDIERWQRDNADR